jgi:hypothetical protein
MRKYNGFVALLAFIILAAIAVFAFVGYMNAQSAESKARTQAILDQQQTTQTPSGGQQTITPSAGLYSYQDVKPYYNLYFEDNTGAAVSPTVYFYTTDPAAQPNGAYWGDERAWADSSSAYYTSGTATSGKLQKQFVPGLKLWFHATVASYKDVYSSFTTAARGDITPSAAVDSNAGITVGTFKMPQYDTTAWTGSAIDFGASANATNAEFTKDVTYTVANNKYVGLNQLKLINVSEGTLHSSGDGIRKLSYIVNGKEVLVYDGDAGVNRAQYSTSGNCYGQCYDSSSYAADKAIVTAGQWNQQQIGSIRFHMFADTREAVTCTGSTGYACPNNVTSVVYLYDNEGTAIISAQNLII